MQQTIILLIAETVALGGTQCLQFFQCKINCNNETSDESNSYEKIPSFHATAIRQNGDKSLRLGFNGGV